MSVGYTYLLSVYVLGFENAGFLTQQIRLKSASCTSDQCFAIGFLQTPCYQDALAKSLLLPTYRAEQWTYTTSSAPCRAHLQDGFTTHVKPFSHTQPDNALSWVSCTKVLQIKEAGTTPMVNSKC